MQSCGSLDDVALRKSIGPNRTSEVRRVVWLLTFASLNCISLFLAYIYLSTTSEFLLGSNILSKALRFARARALGPSPPPLSPPRPAISTFNSLQRLQYLQLLQVSSVKSTSLLPTPSWTSNMAPIIHCVRHAQVCTFLWQWSQPDSLSLDNSFVTLKHDSSLLSRTNR